MFQQFNNNVTVNNTEGDTIVRPKVELEVKRVRTPMLLGGSNLILTPEMKFRTISSHHLMDSIYVGPKR